MEKVSVPSQHPLGDCPAVLVKKGSSRGLVVLQEWWGLNKQIQDEAKHLADQGDFMTIVPDLYRGKVTDDREQAGHLMGGLDWPGAIQDIQGCARYLKGRGCKKVGVMGFCMGGALSMAAAVLAPEIDAAAPFYGIPGPDFADVSKIRIPIQCHFGEKDEIQGFSDIEQQKKLKEKLQSGKVQFEFYSYDAKHAFTNETGDNYDEKACKQSFDRAIDFFKKHLS